MRLLIVDENTTARDELTALLEADGQTVTGVTNAAEALTTLQTQEFEIMFSALTAGRRSGLKLLAESRSRWPRMSVVMVAESGTVEDAVSALHQGAFDYLRKPVQPDQVRRVLELVRQEMTLVGAGAVEHNPVEYARALAVEGGYEVLLISPPPAPAPVHGVIHVDLEVDSPVKIREVVEDFARPRQHAAVVLAAVDRLLLHHREEQIAELLDSVAGLLEGKGPLAVAYDPTKITASGALAVRASIVSGDAHSTFETLGNPIRRLVLRRLAEGPCTFSQAMEAAHLDDTSKISFHLRKLVDSGLAEHGPEKRYRLTARGEGAIDVLNGVDRLDSEKGSGNAVFAWKTSAQGPKQTPPNAGTPER
jgi:CheY-like chemotaxis protein/DNA-binding transcriptional ArsR family regulator